MFKLTWLCGYDSEPNAEMVQQGWVFFFFSLHSAEPMLLRKLVSMWRESKAGHRGQKTKLSAVSSSFKVELNRDPPSPFSDAFMN